VSDWFIQQSGFSSDKTLGPITAEQVVSLFLRGEINKKTPLASQRHTNNEWIAFKDSALWSKAQQVMREQKDKKAQQAAALKQQKDEERQQLQQQREQERTEAENQRQQQQLAIQQTAEDHAAAQRQTTTNQGQDASSSSNIHHSQSSNRLVTNIKAEEIDFVLLVGTVLVFVGVFSVVGGLFTFIAGIVMAFGARSPMDQASAIAALEIAVPVALYGLLTVGVGAAMKIFGRMGQLLEQNTLTLLRILDQSKNMSGSS
jgi:hypothetical protein